MNDTVRTATVFICMFDIGVIIALYERVGHSFLPRLWMRVLMLSSVVWLAAAAAGMYARLGEPMTWRTPTFCATAAAELVAFIGLYHWYGTPAGRAHAARMLEKEKP